MLEHPATDFARASCSSDLIGRVSMHAGVAQFNSHTVLPSSEFNSTLSHWLPSFQSRVVVVGHLVAFAITANDVIAIRLDPVPSRSPMRCFIAKCASTDLLSSLLTGVGHEPEPLSDVRSPDARSRDTDCPEGVAFAFQVILNKVEPPVGNRCINLFTKDDWRSLGPYKMEPMRP